MDPGIDPAYPDGSRDPSSSGTWSALTAAEGGQGGVQRYQEFHDPEGLWLLRQTQSFRIMKLFSRWNHVPSGIRRESDFFPGAPSLR